MTIEYLARRILYKNRVISDFDKLAVKKLTSGYIYFISIIILAQLTYFLSYFAIIDENIKNEFSKEILWFMNIYLLFALYRIWHNQKNLKFKSPEPERYIKELSEYSVEDLNLIVIQGGRRQRMMESLVRSMQMDQFIISTIAIIFSIYQVYTILFVDVDPPNFIFLLLFLIIITSSLGFLLGVRQNVNSFKKHQKSIVYKTRKIFIDCLVFSQLNPGSNEIRKPNK